VKGTPESGKIRLVESRKIAKEKREICECSYDPLKIAKPTVEISDKVRLNLEKFVWSSREK
jgi:hypothetical protein